MASSANVKTDFTAEESMKALAFLDGEISKSKNLRKVVPLKIIVAGGFIATAYLKNRTSTEDIDYIVDPNLKNKEKIEQKFQAAIHAVAKQQNYTLKWANDSVAVFAVGQKRESLFEESISQSVILWEGKNLIVYVVKWEWALEQKLKRLATEDRSIDRSDAVHILKLLVEKNGGPLSKNEVKEWNKNIYTPIKDSVLDNIGRIYEDKYGAKGFV